MKPMIVIFDKRNDKEDDIDGDGDGGDQDDNHDEADLDLAMCGWGRNAGHTADHHNHRGCQHDSEAQAAENWEKSSEVETDVSMYIPVLVSGECHQIIEAKPIAHV